MKNMINTLKATNFIFIFLSLFLCATLVNSQTEEEQIDADIEDNISNADIDFAVPESPAFAILGLSPEEIVRPTSPRGFATELLNGIDRNGNFQSGVAIDSAPYLLLNGRNVTLDDYRTNMMTQILTNSQISLATAKGSSDDDKSIRIATGLKIVSWNRGDPRKYVLKENEDGTKVYWLDDCFRNQVLYNEEVLEINRTIRRVTGPRQAEAERNRRRCEEAGESNCERFEQELNELTHDIKVAESEKIMVVKAEECRKELRKLTWNRSAWSLGVAPTWISTSGNTDDIGWDGLGLWTSLAYGFEGIPTLERTSQFILHARYRTDEEVPIEDMDGEFSEQDTVFVGGRLIVGKPTIAASFEGGYTYIDPQEGQNDHSFMGSIGGNIKIVDNVWLDLSIGARSSDDTSDGQVFVLNSLKWGFQSAPSISTGP